MPRNTLIKAGVSLFILGVCIFWAYPLNEKINLGLDLKGGMHLVFRIDTSKLSPQERRGVQDRALEILRNRIDQFGVREPLIQPQGKDQIVVQLPGVTDRERAIGIIGQTALLEFKLVEDDPQLLKQAFEGKTPENYELKTYKDTQLLLEKKPELTGKYITDAQVKFDQSMQPYVSLTLNSKGTRIFAQVTENNTGKRLAIVLDGKVKSAPVIREAIPSGNASISGNFSYEEAQDLALVLRAGALPCPMVLEEERTVGPLLGQDSINKGIKASILAGAIIGLFMIIYYTLAGLVAVLGLIFTLSFILGVLAYFGATLTLPGIAGIILTLGMAVDANVLIFERIREESNAGKGLLFAVNSGFKKASSAILDSNITTLIAAFFLLQFGTGPIKGFGLTLMIGLLGSMFSALVFCKFVFEFLIQLKIIKSLPMLSLFKRLNINFIRWRKFCITGSLLIIVLGMFAFFKNYRNVFGIDFSGGQLVEFRFKQRPDLEKIRQALLEKGIKEYRLQQYKEDPKIVLIRTDKDCSFDIRKVLNKYFPQGYEFLRQESVGPVVGKELKKKALRAIVFSLVGILIYVGFRFKHLSFGLAGVMALFHDVLITISFLMFTHRLIDLLIVSALLTIAGYSINDTIVIYDRIREIYPRMRKTSLKEIINTAINQTFSRTIITSLTTVMVVFILYLKGGQVLNDFSFSLIVGFIAGTYSTIFIASPLVLLFQKKSL